MFEGSNEKNKSIELADLQAEAELEKLVEGDLFAGCAKNASLERVLKHKNIVFEMAPTFDDELLLRIFDALHIYTSRLESKSHEDVLNLLSVIAVNPYNAFRIVDLLSFLVFFFPRRGKISNDPLAQNGLNALVEAPVLILDRELTHKPEVDNKYFKAANYVDVLSRLLAAN